jgi:hypothetical protein
MRIVMNFAVAAAAIGGGGHSGAKGCRISVSRSDGVGAESGESSAHLKQALVVGVAGFDD